MTSSPVVRFAPSPTGYLHIGGARTAIFNWLYARKHGGKFILRIEDTDADRTTPDSIDGILNGLAWLGLDWDAGPDFQSHHVDDHLDAARRLLASGHAYRCFCSKEMLEEKRSRAQAEKRSYQYDGACRGLTEEEANWKAAEGNPWTIRLKVPRDAGAVVFEDAVVGRVEKRHADIEDFVIVRSNGKPLYVLSNAVDDIRDGVTHIIRGQDGLANTPKQVLIYQSLGAPHPVFAHMSLTLDPAKAKISKRRHGEKVAIQYYRDIGFLPWAMVNFLILLGWGTRDSREHFTREELISLFSLDGISRTNSVFDLRADDPKFITDPKLVRMNAHYLRSLPVEDILPHQRPHMEAAGLWQPAFDGEKRKWLLNTLDLVRGRYHRLTDVADYGRAFFSDDFDMDSGGLDKHLLAHPEMAELLPVLGQQIEVLDVYSPESVEGLLKAFLAEHSLKAGTLVNAVRMAATGQPVGPGFIEVLMALGQKVVADRLNRAADIYSRAAGA